MKRITLILTVLLGSIGGYAQNFDGELHATNITAEALSKTYDIYGRIKGKVDFIPYDSLMIMRIQRDFNGIQRTDFFNVYCEGEFVITTERFNTTNTDLDSLPNARKTKIEKQIYTYTEEGFFIKDNAVSFTTSNSETKDSTLFIKHTNAITQAQFIGGKDDLLRYIAENVKVIKTPRIVNGISEYKEDIQFSINIDGSLSDITFLNHTNYCYQSTEIERVLKTMPKWTPKQIYGKPVTSTHTLSINSFPPKLGKEAEQQIAQSPNQKTISPIVVKDSITATALSMTYNVVYRTSDNSKTCLGEMDFIPYDSLMVMRIQWNDSKNDTDLFRVFSDGEDIVAQSFYKTTNLNKDSLYSKNEIILYKRPIFTYKKGNFLMENENSYVFEAKVSQEPKDTKKFIAHTNAYTMPSFPGGQEACMKYLANHIKYPTICIELGIQGRVNVDFVVAEDGSVSDIKIVSSPHPYLSKEAERVIQKMPKWEPAKVYDKPCRTQFHFPVMFELR